ncbi:Dimethylaniline monooxygenase like protein [Argiope bruennichi]|uniref:Flavin-containing monooxygenase n=1 Tax=Argiope bruennichi TaxID=94029 RepID=A0A8T0FI75_ARGBR|nr:Dimethylaniline monooxygenase like protein [Argiope bruennichi]
MKKTVAVIGAGSSGISAIKVCKEEGIDVVCYEKTNRIGGLWNYAGGQNEGATVMKSTVINSHKEMSAFSDFPPPSHFPNYMHNSQVQQYFLMYAENFELLPHIRYNHDVVRVSKSSDYEETGRWKVVFKILPDEKEFEQIFDGFMLCNGHHACPRMPQFPGQSDFLGPVIHSQSLKVPDDFKDLNVLVVGIGNSGVDAAVELSNVAKQLRLYLQRIQTAVFPFMKESILNSTNNELELYKLTFSPDLQHPTLAVIGLVQVFGSHFPIEEAQSRWFAQLMNGKVVLPDRKEMKKEISRRRKAMDVRFVDSARHTVEVDFIHFMDDITREYGATPNMRKLLLTDPKLFFACLVGPGLPYQYRLNGPHSWPKARETILNFPSRVEMPDDNCCCQME